MVRLALFFALVLVLSAVLGNLPWIGGIFRSTGCLGIWITAIALSFVLARLGERAIRIRSERAQVRELAAVASSRNQGKLGTMLLAQGRPRRALEPLQAAVEGEPEVAEWSYRLGLCQLELRRPEEALEALRACTRIDEEHAYGKAQMRLAEALARAGRHEDALEALATFERNHGPSSESAFRRGAALKALGRRDEARAAFGEVAGLAAHAPRYQRREAGVWAVRARLATMFLG